MARRPYIAFAIAALLAGCTGGGEDETAATMASRSGSFGVVEIERTVVERRAGAAATDTAAGGDDQRAVLGAVFADYEGVEGGQVLHLLGVGRAATDRDTCKVAGDGSSSIPEPSAAVDLLDAGTLEVSVAGSDAQLAARTFPELGSLVAGVFYAEDAQLAPAISDVDEYRITSTGTTEVPAFDVVVVPPADPAGVIVAGRPAAERPSVRRDEPLDILWDAGDPRDRVDVRLAAGGHLVECSARDDGSFRLPAGALSQLDADDDGRLVLRRVRSQPFDVTGVETAWVDIASTRTVPIVVR